MVPEYEVVWNGRGAMPHQLVDTEYHQVTRSLLERMAPNRHDFPTKREIEAATKRLGLKDESWKHMDGGTIAPASKRRKAR